MTSEPTDTEAHATAGNRQVEDVYLYEIGQRLIDLGEQLRDIGDHTAGPKMRGAIDAANEAEGNMLNEVELEFVRQDLERQIRDAVRRTLTGMGRYRKEYAMWERIVVEYALTKQGFTQREVARLLGVGLSTVNRWAQNPVTYED